MRCLIPVLMVMTLVLPVSADIMIIDDDNGSWGGYEPDVTPYTDACDNIGLGYDVWNTFSSGDPSYADMSSYDVVFWITGSTFDLGPNDPIPTALVTYFSSDGHVFVEGGEVGFDCLQDDSSDPLGAALGVYDWDNDGSANDGTLICLEPAHDIFTIPNAVSVPMNYVLTNYSDIDGMNYVSGTTALMLVGGYSQPGYECMSVKESGGYFGITFTVATGGVTDQNNLTELVENIIDYMGLTPNSLDRNTWGMIKTIQF